MKRVGAGWGALTVSVAVWLFSVLCVVYGIWALATDNWRSSPETLAVIGLAPGREKLTILLAIPLFAAFAVYFAYRVLYLGHGYILYNEEMVVFVLNRRDRRSYRWQDLGTSGVTLRNLGEIEPAVLLLRGWLFTFPDGKKAPVRAVMGGYREFEATLNRKGLLPGGYSWR